MTKQFRLGFGPMSPEIIDAIGSYSQKRQYPLMIIASRNQVDHNSGYVMTTKQLAEQASKYSKEYLWLCRDHCGPYFLDSEKELSAVDAVEATKKTIANDIENGFDLIHIDTSRCENQYQVAEELIKFCLDLNPAIRFEFGTEENVGVTASLEKYRADVAFAKQFPNMEFVVAQTGSLVMEDRQVGTFDVELVKQLVECANQAGVRLKEHNADYLLVDKIKLRQEAGVHALNIAPQLGVIQTSFIKDVAVWNGVDAEWHEFGAAVLGTGKWKKWIIDGDDNTKINIAGHYLFNTMEYRELIKRIGGDIWRVELTNYVHKLIDRYAKNI